MTPRLALATAAALGIALVAVAYVQGLPIPYASAVVFGSLLLALAVIAFVAWAWVGLRFLTLRVYRWWNDRQRMKRRVRTLGGHHAPR